MDTTFAFVGVRIKNAPEAFKHIGFGLATDHLGSSARDDYLTVVDPYNTETQIPVPDLRGVVLYPTPTIRLLLGKVFRFGPDDLKKPSLSFAKGVLPTAVPPRAVLTLPAVVPTIPAATSPPPTVTPTSSTHSVSVSVVPAASGTVTLTPSGGDYTTGTTVIVTALAAPGYVFDHWSGDASGTYATITVTVQSPKNITANFRRVP